MNLYGAFIKKKKKKCRGFLNGAQKDDAADESKKNSSYVRSDDYNFSEIRCLRRLD